jgi:integrase
MTNSNVYWHPKRNQFVGQVELPRGADGVRRRKFFYGEVGNKTKAERRKIEVEVCGEKPCAPDQITVEGQLDAWLAAKKVEEDREIRHSTADTYAFQIKYINQVIGGVRVQALTIDQVKLLMTSLKQDGLSRNMRRNIFRILRAALKRAVGEGILKQNVTDFVTPPPKGTSEMSFLTIEQGRKLLTVARSSNTYFAPVIHLALYTGARLGEVLGLQWTDVDMKEGQIRFTHQLRDRNGVLDKTPCNGESCTRCSATDGRGPIKTASGVRTIPMSPELRADLVKHQERLLKNGLAGSPWVFPSEEGTPLVANNVRRAFKLALKRAKLPEIRFHDLRHTCASVLEELGFTDLQKQRWLGHSDATMTRLYTHIFQERRKKDAEKLHGIYGTAVGL